MLLNEFFNTDTVFEITRDELIANVERRRRQQFVDKILNFLHQAVKSGSAKQSVGGYAFDVARQVDLGKIGLDAKSLEKLYRERYSITEGYQLKLERDPDADLLVLHVKDTKTGRRSEVRGKLGYETGGYDPEDRLHQLLDKIGKAANVSELINGETVSINPKHPQGHDAEKAAQTITNESLDNPYPVTWKEKTDEWWNGVSKTDAGDEIKIYIEQVYKSHRWEIDFKVGDSMLITGKGDQFRIFATIVKAIKQWWNWISKSKQPVESIGFSAFKGNENTKGGGRSKLYSRFAAQFAQSIGFDAKTVDAKDSVKFVLKNPNYNTVNENFADNIPKMSIDDIHTPVIKRKNNGEKYVSYIDGPNGEFLVLHDNGKYMELSSRNKAYLKKEFGLNENFADGKVKGKSRPGRFKRAGVSCKGSVTSLRKKAKNSSGEKQKGYHWCANMKSGRKNK